MKSLIQIFLSSRDTDDIILKLEGVPNLYIEAKDNTDDIERFVHQEIACAITFKDLLGGTVGDQLRHRISSTLVRKANGM